MTFGFAVVQVIISVFIQQTFKMASRDEEVMIKERTSAAGAYIRSLERLFNELDESGDGFISWEEFSSVLKNERIKTWFAAMEVDISELPALFEMLDDGDRQIGRDEFITSVKKIKGNSKSMDIPALRSELKRVTKNIGWIKDAMITGRQSSDIASSQVC
mmetsp:Transcript_172792/g.553917  ORF Transcript_172792/g.553917 Transcript_172792/m.553917 type:complete len:160 (-) Transcript_172792:150-629(-)